MSYYVSHVLLINPEMESSMLFRYLESFFWQNVYVKLETTNNKEIMKLF